jgi:orotate phosphoribosyltransferase
MVYMDEEKLYRHTYELGMVRVDPDDPFELSSGRYSPIYIDGRKWSQDPDARDGFGTAMAEEIKGTKPSYDIIAGGATAGIPYGLILAEEEDLPFVYVRKEPKGHGRGARIEGMDDLDGMDVLLVEDLTTTGNSLNDFADGIEQAGGTVEDCLVFYDRAEGAEETLQSSGLALHSVISLDELITHGNSENHLTAEEHREAQAYLDDPDGWDQRYRTG